MKTMTSADRLLIDSLTNRQYVLAKHALARGANPNARSPSGDTALHLAAGAGHYGLVVELLAAGADRHEKDAMGRSAKDLAARSKAHFVVRKLACA